MYHYDADCPLEGTCESARIEGTVGPQITLFCYNIDETPGIL